MTATSSPAPDESSNRAIDTTAKTTAGGGARDDDVCIAEGDVADLRGVLGRAAEAVREWEVDDEDDGDAEETEGDEAEGGAQASLYYDESTMASLNPFSVVRRPSIQPVP